MSERGAVVIDFDGTICEYRFPDVGEPKEGVVEAITAIKEAGFYVVIHSCRTASYWERQDQGKQYQIIAKFLDDHEIPYDWICDSDKPVAMYYIDDRGLKFEDNWDEIAKIVTEVPEGIVT